MAQMPDPIKVSAEAVAHKVIVEVLQKIFDDFGIIVNDISVDWIDLPQINKHDAICISVRLRTAYRAKE